MEDLFCAERMSLIMGDRKYTFLKPYGDKMKSHVLVINQHMHTDETRSDYYTYDQIVDHFHQYGGSILGYINRMIPTFKPR